MAVKDAERPCYRQLKGSTVIYVCNFAGGLPAGFGISSVETECTPDEGLTVDPNKIVIDDQVAYVAVAVDAAIEGRPEIVLTVYALNSVLGTKDPLSVLIIAEDKL
jgi:hypothetical protein